MSNSPLVTYTNLTSHRNSPRAHAIDTITIHCSVGQVTARQGCDYFASTDREASSNYVVGCDGSIGLSVEEKDRSWCSGGEDAYGNPILVNGISGADNDHRAITIETACDAFYPYAVTGAAYSALIELCTDICRRNGIKKLLWKGDKSLVGQVEKQNMTVHRWFAATACPGDWLYERMGDIAGAVNRKLLEEEKEDNDMNYFKTLNDVPTSYQPAIRKLMERGVLKGVRDPDPNSLEDNILNVSEDYCRVMTTLDRLGKLD